MFAAVAPSFAADLPAPKPTARDLYVACYLLAHDTGVLEKDDGSAELFSSDYCKIASLSMITNREGEANTAKYKFCLDNGAAISADPPKAMAFAYLDFFESGSIVDTGMDGSAAYLMAMMARWPCKDR